MPVMPICKGSVLWKPAELYAMLQEGGQLHIQTRGKYSSEEKAVFEPADTAGPNRCIASIAGKRRKCDFLVCHNPHINGQSSGGCPVLSLNAMLSYDLN
jgi:hypothetical protein